MLTMKNSEIYIYIRFSQYRYYQKMNKISFPSIQSIVLALCCISLSTTLVASTICRNSLYLAFYLSVIDLFIKRPKITFNQFTLIFFAILALSLTLFLPTIFLESVSYHSVDQNYITTSKRIFFGAIIFIYLSSVKDKLSNKAWLIASLLIIVGFIYNSIVALKLHHENPDQRLEIVTLATAVAYVYALHSFCTIYIVSKFNYSKNYIVIALVVSLSYYIILLTQTRSVILSYPIILFLFLLKNKLIDLKFVSIIVLLCFSAIVLNLSIVKTSIERVAFTAQEVKGYENETKDTSLGSRFSLWKAGVSSFKHNPWGQSADQRNIFSEGYIIKYENANREALRCIGSHYHNDFVEMLSLRGIIGMVVSVIILLMLVVSSYKITKSINIHILLFLPAITYGLTDTLLIDHRCVTIFILLLPFYLLRPKSIRMSDFFK
ncbi:O-antigen ligase domain-containing protein [Serratia sp. S1B]|nr:O-antigen ligase domain-containing protein [Serratia sp. S1B]